MKTKSTLRPFLLGCSSLLAASSIHAADVTWDTAPGTIGAGDSAITGGTGTWNTTAAVTPNGNWTVDGGVLNIAWVNANNDTAIFGGTAGTVTVDTGGVTVGGLTFNTNNYVVSGDPITFGAAGIISNSGTVTINSAITGSVGISKSGNGLLDCRGALSYTGDTAVNAGTIQIGRDSSSLGGGNYAGNISIASGATFFLYSNTAHTLSGLISGAGDFRTGGGGTTTLTGNNTYTGKTLIASGGPGDPSLSVSSLNSVDIDDLDPLLPMASSSLGAPTTVANGTIQLGAIAQRGHTLIYTGPGETTDRVIDFYMNASGATKTIEVTDPDALLRFTSKSTRQGSTENDVTLKGAGDGRFDYGLELYFRFFTKAGDGTWTIGGPVLNHEATTLQGGTLSISTPISDAGFETSVNLTNGSPIVTLADTTGMQPGMLIISPNVALGTRILTVDSPTQFTMDSNATGTFTRTANIGESGSLGFAPNGSDKLRWDNSATLQYTGPDDSTNRNFSIDNAQTATWDITSATLTVSGNSNTTSGKITKAGAGTLIFSGTLQHTGSPNAVSDGTLLINGDASAMTGAVEVAGDATFGGTGTIGGALTVADTGKLTFDLSTAPGGHDKLDVAGAVTLPTGPETSELTITSAGGATTGTYTLITAVGGITGDVPVTVSLPLGWTADAPQIVGNDLQINITSTGTVGSAYSTWASTNAPTGNPDDDYDGDGVSNAVEFVLGGLASTNDLGKLPVPATSGGNMTFTFNRATGSIDPGKTSVTIEVSTDLVTWTTPPSPYTVPDTATGPVNPGVTVVEDTSPGFDTVTLTVPQDVAKKFARLNVVITP